MSTRNSLPVSLALLLSLAGMGFATSASADWLVTVTGEEVETAGPWEQRGRLIVFKRTDGTLASIRASLVDQSASRQLTAAPAPTPIVEPAEVPAPVVSALVLNDDNIREYRSDRGTFNAPSAPAVVADAVSEDATSEAAASGAESAEGETTQNATSATQEPDVRVAPQGLIVDAWRTVQTDAGTEIHGKVINTGDSVQAQIRLDVAVYGADEELITRRTARLANPILTPGRDSAFRLLLPQTYGVERAEFTLASTLFQARNTEAETPTEIGALRALGEGSQAAPTQPTGAGP